MGESADQSRKACGITFDMSSSQNSIPSGKTPTYPRHNSGLHVTALSHLSRGPVGGAALFGTAA